MEATEERKKWKKKTQDKSRKPIPAESSHEEPSKEERQNDVGKDEKHVVKNTLPDQSNDSLCAEENVNLGTSGLSQSSSENFTDFEKPASSKAIELKPRSEETVAIIPDYDVETNSVIHTNRSKSLSAIIKIDVGIKSEKILAFKIPEIVNIGSTDPAEDDATVSVSESTQLSTVYSNATRILQENDDLFSINHEEIEVDIAKICAILEDFPKLELESTSVDPLPSGYQEIMVDVIGIRAMLEETQQIFGSTTDQQISKTKSNSHCVTLDSKSEVVSDSDLNNNGGHSSDIQDNMSGAALTTMHIESRTCQSTVSVHNRSPQLSPSLVNDLAQYYGFNGQKSTDQQGIQFVRARRTEQVPLPVPWNELHRMIDDGERTPPWINRGNKPVLSPIHLVNTLPRNTSLPEAAGQLPAPVTPLPRTAMDMILSELNELFPVAAACPTQTANPVPQMVTPAFSIFEPEVIPSESTVSSDWTTEHQDEESPHLTASTSAESLLHYIRSPYRRRVRSLYETNSSSSLVFHRKTGTIPKYKPAHQAEGEVDVPKPVTRMGRAKSWVSEKIGRMGRWFKEKVKRKDQTDESRSPPANPGSKKRERYPKAPAHRFTPSPSDEPLGVLCPPFL